MNPFKTLCIALIPFIAVSCITFTRHANIPTGTWKMVSCKKNGQDQPVQKIFLTFNEDRFQVKVNDTIVESGTTTFNTSVIPMQYDVLLDKDKQGNQKTYHAIYKIHNGMMTACINVIPEGKRPKNFTAAKGTSYRLVTWQTLTHGYTKASFTLGMDVKEVLAIIGKDS